MENIFTASTLTAEDIRNAYLTKTKNTYWATLVDKTHQMVFFKIDNSEVIVGCLLKNYCLNRFESFNDVIVPNRMQVVITNIDKKNRFVLSALPGFLGFDESVALLGLEPYKKIEGKVLSGIQRGPNFSGITILTPNLSTLISGPVNAKVSVMVKKIYTESKKVKCELDTVLEHACGEPFDCRPFVVSYDLPDWIDMDEWRAANVYRKPDEAPVVTEPKPLVEPEYKFHSTSGISPFSTNFNNERVSFEGRITVRPNFYSDAVYKGILTQEHRLLATAFSELKFATAHLLTRYMHLRYGKLFPKGEERVSNMLKTLAKTGVLNSFRYVSDGDEDGEEKKPGTIVYFPGEYYKSFTSLRPLQPYYTATLDASISKRQLAADQLAIAVLHKYREAAPTLTPRTVQKFGNDVYLAYLFKLETTDGILYLESLRRKYHKEFLQKLERYDQYFKECPDAIGTVCIIAEDTEELEYLKKEIPALNLRYSVALTTDLECIPFEPVMIHPATTANKTISFLNLFRRK